MKAAHRWAAGACLWLASGAAFAQTYLLNLTTPQAGQPPYPAVLLLHGCSGILENEPMWQAFLASKGYASASVDSFQRRRVSEICTDFSRVRMPERVKDAYAALVELTSRPDIDPKRVAVMGFSNGGLAVLSTLSTVINAQLAPSSPRFRAGIALYPDCSAYRPQFSQPILTVIGQEDDWTPASACEKLASQVPADRPAFEVKVLPGAHHSFDVVRQPRYYMGRAVNMHKPGGYGATVEGHPKATETAKQAIEAFLNRELASAP